MTSRGQRFGELRSLLQQAPSEASWARLCEHLMRWTFDAHFEAETLPYLTEALESWPQDLKVAPGGWVRPLLGTIKKEAPLLSLVTSLDLTTGVQLHPRALARLFHAQELAHITTLDLSYNDLGPAGARLLAASPHIHNLRTLLLIQTNLQDEGAIALAQCERLQNLVTLDLSDARVTEPGCRALERSPYLRPEIRALAFDWYDERHPYDDTME